MTEAGDRIERPPRRTSGFVTTLVLGPAAWLLFVLSEVALRARLAFASTLLPSDYDDRFFGLVLFLLALVPVLVVTGTLAVRRRQVRWPVALAAILVFVAVNFALLRGVRPFFVTVFPG